MDRFSTLVASQVVADFLTWLQSEDILLCTDMFDGVQRERFFPIIWTKRQVLEQYLNHIEDRVVEGE